MKNKYESPNAKMFKAAKKVKRAKVVKKRFVKAIIPTVAGLGVALALAMPYIDSYNTINEFLDVSHDDIVQVDEEENIQNSPDDNFVDIAEKVDDDVPWGNMPEGLVFDENVVGYLSDDCGIFNTVLPIAQSSLDDPTYFLDHNVYGEPQQFGTPFKDSRNERVSITEKNAYGSNIIVYGHDLDDGSMFGTLAYYVNQDFYDKQKEMFGKKANKFYYTDEYGQYECTIVAAGIYDGNEALKYVGSFQSEKEKKEFINFFKKGSNIVCDEKFGSKDEMYITLQTCPKDFWAWGDDERVYVIGILKPIVKCK